MKKVSIVIPIYNAEKYLDCCLDSISNQTYKNLEIICVDDGSTDNTASIIEKYQKKDSRIQYIWQKNSFAGIARNRGLDIATGEYIIFLDADDVYYETMITQMVNVIEKTSADVVICGCEGYDEKRKEKVKIPLGNTIDVELLSGKEVFSPREIPDYIFQIKAGWVWDTMYRSSFIREKRIRFQEIRDANDALFCCLANAEANKIAIIDKNLVIHRFHSATSLWATRASWWYCSYEMLYELRKELKERNLYELYEKSYMNWAADYIMNDIYELVREKSFFDLYQYYQQEGKKEFHFLDYGEDFYYRKFTYEILTQLEQKNETEFLMYRINGLLDTVDNLSKDIEILKKRKKWRIPNNSISIGSKIAVYGYGDVGQDYCEQLMEDEEYELVLVVDNQSEKWKDTDRNILPVQELENASFDFVIVAIYNGTIAQEVITMLEKMNIAREKILWFDPAGQMKEKMVFL